MGSGTDLEGNKLSQIQAKGCRVEGYLDVPRVPGSIIIHPHSTSGHEFDTRGLVDLTHVVSHLSFGNKWLDSDGPYALKDKSAFSKTFPGSGKSHAHSLRIVSRTRVDLRGNSFQQFEYSVASDNFLAKGENKIPLISFDYDLSPLQIVVKEKKKGLLEGFVAILAIIGGVWSGFHIIEAILSSFAGVLKNVNSSKIV